MVGTILSVGHGGSESNRSLAVGAHVVGALLGGSILGVALASIQRLIPFTVDRELMFSASGVVAVAYAFHELRMYNLPIFQRRKQVPQVWAYLLKPYAFSFLYGLALGIAVLVYIQTATLYPVVIYATLAGGWSSVVLGAAFGLGRGLPLLAMHVGQRLTRWKTVEDLASSLDRSLDAAHRLNGYMLALGGSFLVVVGGPW